MVIVELVSSLAYVGRVENPDWLSIEFIQALFGRSPVQSFRSAYRRQLEEMAGLGKWQDSWKDSSKRCDRLSVLLGTTLRRDDPARAGPGWAASMPPPSVWPSPDFNYDLRPNDRYRGK